MSNELMCVEDIIGGVMQEAKQLSGGLVSLEAEQNYAIQQIYKNQMAADVAVRNPVSVQNAIRNLSAIGISLNPATKHAYLVPRDKAICLDISYMGLMHLAQQTGSILWGQARIVYSNDKYENQGLTKEPLHVFNSFGHRGDKVGVYCCVKLPNGDFLTEEMSAKQVEEVKNTSKAKNSSYSPWVTFEEEMWKKSAVKRASKYWPSNSARLQEAIHVINEHEGLEDDTNEKVELIKKLNMYASDQYTPMELFGFVKSVKDERLNQWLCGQFKKGEKTAGVKKIGEGRNQYFAYLEIFKGDDVSAIEEAKDELTKVELSMINSGLNN